MLIEIRTLFTWASQMLRLDFRHWKSSCGTFSLDSKLWDDLESRLKSEHSAILFRLPTESKTLGRLSLIYFKLFLLIAFESENLILSLRLLWQEACSCCGVTEYYPPSNNHVLAWPNSEIRRPLSLWLQQSIAKNESAAWTSVLQPIAIALRLVRVLHSWGGNFLLRRFAAESQKICHRKWRNNF